MIQFSIFGETEDTDCNNTLAPEFHSIVGCLGASSHSLTDRERNDFYATDPVAAEWLMKIEKLNHNIWEPSVGAGHLAKVFIAGGHEVKCTDLIDRGFGQGGVDFLACNDKWQGDIITNPPYNIATEFIYHALSLVDDGNKVCMFLKVQFLEGKSRKELFEKFPPRRVWVTSSRINCGRNGNFAGMSTMLAHAWFVWEKGYQGDTVLKWFN